jgi:hypothetical protein
MFSMILHPSVGASMKPAIPVHHSAASLDAKKQCGENSPDGYPMALINDAQIARRLIPDCYEELSTGRAEAQVVESAWISTRSLAVFVLSTQLGHTWQAIVPPDGRVLEIGGQMVARAEHREAIRDILALFDELSLKMEPVMALRRESEPLERDAARLIRNMKQVLLSSKLPGRCRLSKI